MQFKNNYFTEMCSGPEADSYLRRIDFVYHSTLGLRVIMKKTASERRGNILKVLRVCYMKAKARIGP